MKRDNVFLLYIMHVEVKITVFSILTNSLLIQVENLHKLYSRTAWLGPFPPLAYYFFLIYIFILRIANIIKEISSMIINIYCTNVHTSNFISPANMIRWSHEWRTTRDCDHEPWKCNQFIKVPCYFTLVHIYKHIPRSISHFLMLLLSRLLIV